MSFIDIESPECVEKGKRNHWLVSVILSCKWKGLSQAETRALLSRVIPRVFDWQKSQSLTRGLGAILRSLFHHRSSLKGQSPDLMLPFWLIEAMQTNKSKKTSQIFYKKGSLRDFTPSGSESWASFQQDSLAASSGALSLLALSNVMSPCSGTGHASGQVCEVHLSGWAEPLCSSAVAIFPNHSKDSSTRESNEGPSPVLVCSRFFLDPDG
jgi:hypothetical protein